MTLNDMSGEFVTVQHGKSHLDNSSLYDFESWRYQQAFQNLSFPCNVSLRVGSAFSGRWLVSSRYPSARLKVPRKRSVSSTCMLSKRDAKDTRSEAPEGLLTIDPLIRVVEEVSRALKLGREAGELIPEEMKGISLKEEENELSAIPKTIETSSGDFKAVDGEVVRSECSQSIEDETVLSKARKAIEDLLGRVPKADRKERSGVGWDPTALYNVAAVIAESLKTGSSTLGVDKRISDTEDLVDGLQQDHGPAQAQFAVDKSQTEQDETSLVNRISSILVSRDISPSDILDSAGRVAQRVLGLDEDDESEIIKPPITPPFNGSSALVLAGYAFQAYLSPPPGCYWEEFIFNVKGSNLSGRAVQQIRTQFAYMHRDIMAGTFVGLFSLLLKFDGSGGDLSPLKNCFVVATLNGSMYPDALRQSFVYILHRGSKWDSSKREDVLELRFYESKRAYEDGLNSLGYSRISLSQIGLLKENVKPWSTKDLLVPIYAVTEEDVASNYFKFDLLPDGVTLPFASNIRSVNDQATRSEALQSHLVRRKVRVTISYCPFESDQFESMPDTDRYDDKDTNAGTTEAESTMSSSGAEPITRQEKITRILKDGGKSEMPLPEDWKALVALAKSGVKKSPTFLKDFTRPALSGNLDPVLFVRSVDTSTEVWFFRDQRSKSVVASFRGTEQVEWRDFFTDALMFMQEWNPAEEIDLDVKGFFGGGESEVASEAKSKVHYGFLRAYFSVRHAVDRALKLLTEGYDPQYHIYFTGHSLGGALSTLCAVDLKNKYGSSFLCSVYNYGSPKVGNARFAQIFNDTLKDAFRVVNDSDLITRMPKSKYKHVGRTVLISTRGNLWIEGEHDGVDPLRERYRDIREQIREESEMWNSLVSGKSLEHHMETSYFLAMERIISVQT